MLMPKKDRKAIYTLLFQEGVLVAKKDIFAPKHPQMDVPNLHVIKAMTGLKSKGYVKEQFCWRHYYWYLTNEGIQYLREYLHLPPEIVPATLKRTAAQRQGEMARPLGAAGAPKQGDAVPLDRQGYRRDDKAAVVGSGTAAIGFPPVSAVGGNYRPQIQHPFNQQTALRSASVSALHYPTAEGANFRQQQAPQHHASLARLNSAPSSEPYHIVVPQQFQKSSERTEKNQPIQRGWLFHWEGWPIKLWHKRWAVLRIGLLNIYKSSTSDKLLNSFLLHNYQITASGREDKNYRKFGFRCEAPGLKTLYFATETENDMRDWTRALQAAIQPHGTLPSRPANEQRPINGVRDTAVVDYTQNSQTLPYQRSQFGAPTPATMPYQQPRFPPPGYYYKQSPPLPPPVRFPPPSQPFQEQQPQAQPQQPPQMHQLPPSQQSYQQSPSSRENYQQLPPSHDNYQQVPPSRDNYQQVPPPRDNYQQVPPSRDNYQQIPTSFQDQFQQQQQQLQQQQLQQQEQEQQMSTSRQRYGAFIQQLDEERRRRSTSMIGLSSVPASSGRVMAQQAPPSTTRNAVPNSVNYINGHVANQFGGYNPATSVHSELPSPARFPAPFSYKQPEMTASQQQQPVQKQPETLTSISNQWAPVQEPLIVKNMTQDRAASSRQNFYHTDPRHEVEMPTPTDDSGNLPVGVTVNVPRQPVSIGESISKPQLKFDSIYSPSSSGVGGGVDSLHIVNGGSTNSMKRHYQSSEVTQPMSTASLSSRSKIPSLQERMYSLMRCVNSETSTSGGNRPIILNGGFQPTEQQQQAMTANSGTSKPSLTHWLVRDMASATATDENNSRRGQEEDEHSGTLTPAATPSKEATMTQQQRKLQSSSPQYSQVTKKTAPTQQSSSMYVEHWLDAHTADALPNQQTVDNDRMSSPEPPRRVEDLFGKTRDELVLMLIQLRRRQAQGRYVDPTLYQIIEQQLSAERSVISLVDNVVSPYGSNDSANLKRQRNVDRLTSERAMVANQLNQESDADYDNKQAMFWRLDEAVNRQTEVVTSLQEQHQQLIDAINVIRSRMTPNSSMHQLTQLESSLHGIRASLATASRHLESLIFQRNQLEKQLQEIKARHASNFASGPNRSYSVPNGLHAVRQDQQRQQTQPQRFYPQPVAPVAPIVHTQSDERTNGVQSPVYATVRRYSQTQKDRHRHSNILEPISTKATEKERVFTYHSATSQQQQPEVDRNQQPEPIYSRPVRFTSQQQQPPKSDQHVPPQQVERKIVPQPQQSLPSAQTRQMGGSRLAALIQPAAVNGGPVMMPIRNSASLSMLSDAGSEATIDSLARQYTGPPAAVPRQTLEVAGSRMSNSNLVGGDDVELVDMVQRALAVVGEPGSDERKPAPTTTTTKQFGGFSTTTTATAMMAKNNSDRQTHQPAIYTSAPRRFTAHLRQPTPPPPPENVTRQDSLDVEDLEPERFERDIFGAPDKIEIPERYDPSADVEIINGDNDDENCERREQLTERYRQILLRQSLSNLTQEEAANLSRTNDLRSAIHQESVERDKLLRLSQTVAQQAKSASLNQAERLRRMSATPRGEVPDLSPPSMPPPPPPPQQSNGDNIQQGESPTTLWMEFGNREMAIDVC